MSLPSFGPSKGHLEILEEPWTAFLIFILVEVFETNGECSFSLESCSFTRTGSKSLGFFKRFLMSPSWKRDTESHETCHTMSGAKRRPIAIRLETNR